MYIYNVTTNVDESIHDEWLNWMKSKHIPAMLATGKFTVAKMSQVLIEEEMGGVTYAVQYTTEDKTTLEQYYIEDALSLSITIEPKNGNKSIASENSVAEIPIKTKAILYCRFQISLEPISAKNYLAL